MSKKTTPTIHIYQTNNGDWFWFVPAYSDYKDTAHGPFEIRDLAKKHCDFHLENRHYLNERATRSRSTII